MSSPTTRSFDTAGGRSRPEIADFVSAVRTQLDDLSPDEVTELTGGLEADLTDAVAEAGSTPAQLYGDPVEYASELRSAAGLPPRGQGGKTPREARPDLGERVEQRLVVPAREWAEITLRNLDQQPWWPGVREFLVVMRPAWWLVRAWVVVQMLLLVMGNGNSAVRGGAGGLLLLALVVVLSVQVGRRTPLPSRPLRQLVLVWNVVAVLFLLPVMFSDGPTSSSSYYGGGSEYAVEGLSLNGQPVTNVFPYDLAGTPLTGVQLYDQNGRPLEISESDRSVFDEQTGTSFELVPGSPVGMAPRWNAFPLQQRANDEMTGELGPVQPAPLPLNGVPPLLEATTAPASPGADLGADASAGPTAGPGASTTAGPVPTASAAASVSAKPTIVDEETSRPSPTK